MRLEELRATWQLLGFATPPLLVADDRAPAQKGNESMPQEAMHLDDGAERGSTQGQRSNAVVAASFRQKRSRYVA